MTSDKQRAFGNAKRDTLPRYCRECDVRFACHGECPKNRFISTPDGEPGLNYLCAGYKAFFKHIDRPMRMMADLLRRGHYADEVMALLAAQEAERLRMSVRRRAAATIPARAAAAGSSSTATAERPREACRHGLPTIRAPPDPEGVDP